MMHGLLFGECPESSNSPTGEWSEVTLLKCLPEEIETGVSYMTYEEPIT